MSPSSPASGDAYSLNGIALVLCDGNGLCARRQGHVVVGALSEQLKELVGVRGNELRQLGVPGAELLKYGLQHLRLLLDNLAQLLELGVVPKKVQVAHVATLGCGCSRCRRVAGTATTRAAASLLGREVKEVDSPIIFTALRLSGRLRRCVRARGRGGMALLLLLLNIFRNSLHCTCQVMLILRVAPWGRRTFNKYSTARSGLLKAARMAASIWLLSNPIASMLAMASARSNPMAKVEASLPLAGASAERWGVGVAGTAASTEDWAGAAGAAGAAGVLVTGGAGVAGGAADDSAAVAEAAGFSLG